MTQGKDKHGNLAKPTRLAHAGRRFTEHGIVNPPVYHASTILHDNLAAYELHSQPYVYGRRGTPTSRALETAMADIEGGHDACLFPSGLAAIAGVLLAMLKTGDHLLMTDSVYKPTRDYCANVLSRFGIETTYYDPLIGGGIAELIRPETALVYTELPGSLTMEMQDIPAIAAAAKAKDIPVAIDNTWAAGYLFDALGHGCDISLQAGTKYIVGHSDAMLGTVVANERCYPMIRKSHGYNGQCVGPDDIYLALRGLRTLDVRLERHMHNALIVAEWLRGRPEVEEVLYAALPGSPGHDLWKRDFSGACGLFSVVLKPASRDAFAAFTDGLEFFGMGASWGGYESLIVPFEPSAYRSVTHWPYKGHAFRLHIGLEDPQDLIADLKAGLERHNRTA